MAKKKKKNNVITYEQRMRDAGRYITYEERMADPDRFKRELKEFNRTKDEEREKERQKEEQKKSYLDYFSKDRGINGSDTKEIKNQLTRLYNRRSATPEDLKNLGLAPKYNINRKRKNNTTTYTSPSTPYASDEQVARNWNKYLEEQQQIRTKEWQQAARDYQYGYGGIFQDPTSPYHTVRTTDGRNAPVNPYALKMAGASVQSARNLMNAKKEEDDWNRVYNGELRDSDKAKEAWNAFWNREKQGRYTSNGQDRSGMQYSAKQMQDTPGGNIYGRIPTYNEEQERVYNDFKERQKQNARKRTSKWQDLSRDYQNGFGGIFRDPNSEYQNVKTADGKNVPLNPYALKQMGADPDSVRKVMEYQEYLSRQPKAASEQDYINYFKDHDYSSVEDWDKYWKKQQALAETKAVLQEREQEFIMNAAGGRSFDNYNLWNKTYFGQPTQRVTVTSFNKYNQQLNELGKYGILDEGNDPYLMSEAGLQANIEASTQTAQQYLDTANEGMQAAQAKSPDNVFAGVLPNTTTADDKEYLIDRARDFFLHELPGGASIGATQDELRRWTYNRIMEDIDDYETRTENMSDDARADFDAILDKAINLALNADMEQIEGPLGGEQGAAYGTNMQVAQAYSRRAGQFESVQEQNRLMEQYGSAVPITEESAEYDPSLITVKQMYASEDSHKVYEYEPEGPDTDKAYYYMNNLPAENDAEANSIDKVNKYYFRTPEMLETYNSLFRHSKETGDNAAQLYLNAINQYLEECLALYRDFTYRQIAEEPGTNIAARIMSYPMNVVSGIMGTLATGASLIGADRTKDDKGTFNFNKNSKIFIPTDFVQTVRQQQNKNLDDWAVNVFGEGARGKAQFFANVFDSIMDNVTAMNIAGGSSGAAQNYNATKWIIQGVMSGEATSATMLKNLDEGKGAWESALRAVADGVIEWITEEKSIDRWLKPNVGMLNSRQKIDALIKAMAAEGSEEINADLLNIGVDWLLSDVFGHGDEFEKELDRLITEEDMDPAEACRKLMQDKIQEIGLSGLAGAISGAALLGGRVISSDIQQTSIGKQINRTQETGRTTADLIDEALKGGNQKAEYYKLAEGMKVKLDAGQKITNREVGKLATAMQAESLEVLQRADEARFNPKDNEAVPQRQIDEAIRTYSAAFDISTKLTEAEEKAYTGENWAKETDFARAQGERLDPKYRKTEVIAGDEIGRLEATTDKNGKKTYVTEKDGKILYNVNIGGKTRQVTAEELMASDFGTASIIHEAAANKGMYSADFLNKMLELQEGGKIRNVGMFMAEAQNLRLAARLHINEMPQTKYIDRNSAIEIFNDSLREFGVNRKNDLQTATNHKTAKITIDGVEYGDRTAWNKKLKEMKIDKNIRAQMDAVAAYAQRFGGQVAFKTDTQTFNELKLTEDQDATKYYGWEYSQNGKQHISLNINGMDYGIMQKDPKGRHHMLVTFGHEMTHWLQRNSLQGYDQLEKYVLNSLINVNGMQKVQQRLQQHMNNGLTLDGAVSELVADSCDQILGNETVMKHIQDTDPGLYGQVKGFVKDLVEKVKKAMGNMDQSRSWEATAMMGSVNELARLWLGAYDEAISGKIAEANRAQAKHDLNEALANPQEKFSMSMPVEARTDGIVAVHNVSVRNLLKSLRIGGFANLSAAVISENRLWDLYGECSMFLPREVIDPKIVGDLYSGDAMTGMLDGEFTSAKEALDYAATQQYTDKFDDIANRLRHQRNVRSIEEARRRIAMAESLTQEEKIQLEREYKDREIKIINHAFDYFNKQGGNLKDYGRVQHALSDAMYEAAQTISNLEEYDGKMSFKAKMDVLNEKLRTGLKNEKIWDGRFLLTGEEGNKLAKEMLDMIEYVDSTNMNYMLESKNRIITTPQMTLALEIPDTVSQEVIDLITELGIDGDKIYKYDPNAEDGSGRSRYDVMQQIKLEKPNVRLSRAGVDPDTGRTVYISNYAKGTQSIEKGKHIISLIQNIWAHNPIELTVYDKGSEGRKITAEFDPEFDESQLDKEKDKRKAKMTPAGEIAFKRRGSNAEKRVAMNLGDDFYDILQESEYNGNKKDLKGNKNVLKWHYFIDDIYYAEQNSDDAEPYRIQVDVSERKDGTYVYSYRAIAQQNEQKKKLSVMGIGPVNAGNNSGESASASVNSITKENGKSNIQLSRAQVDLDYNKAFENGDKEQMQTLVDQAAELSMPKSKVRDKNGNLLKVYHGTKAEFNKFRRDMIGSTGRFEGSGFNFTPYEGRAASYGTNVLAGYLNIQNPLSAEKKTISVSKLAELIRKADPTGDNIIADYARETRDYGSESFVRREAMTAARNIWNSSENDVDIYSYISAADSDAESLIEVFSDLNYDGLIHYDDDGNIKTAVAFNSNQFKKADPVTYDDNGEPIKLSERFRNEEEDIRYSRAVEEATKKAAENGIDLDVANHSASRLSRASYMRSEYYKDPDKMAKILAQNVLGSKSKENVAKAKKWIEDVTSISALIGDKDILDYVASPGRSSFKSNPEYGGSIDSSTICAKRRLQTGTLDAIQRAMPNYVMAAEDFLQVRRMMKEKGYEVSCGLCFVESSRKNIAKYASQFMNEWNSQHPDNKVDMTQINTVLGLEDTRLNNKEVYDAYEKFMNKLAQRKPKLFEMRSEYDNDILKHFKNGDNIKDESVKEKNKRGGMRINSFSDFEVVHLIDMMQVIMDMSNVGLAGQSYTKVREFAEALGPTGLKINMSMIAAGVDENGKIIFDEVEGMKWDDVKDLRDKYADNVGTVCVVFTEDQLMAAMADDRIDFIIPFHRSQWNKSNYKDIGLPDNVKDFTYWQNERYAKPVYGTKKDGTQKKLRATNYMPNEYWDFSKSGKENAEAYLEMCYKNNKIPKFWKWLQADGNGKYSLKADGSTDGYWKLLGDFKMYNHLTNKGAEQMPVRPDFDMKASQRMLQEYKGGHESFPVAEDVVRDFVKEKQKGKKGISTGEKGKLTLAGPEIENMRKSQRTEESMDVDLWMQGLTEGSFRTDAERQMWQAWKSQKMNISLTLKRIVDTQSEIRKLEGKTELTAEDRDALTKLQNRLGIQQEKLARLEDELQEITSGEGYAAVMRRAMTTLNEHVSGKTQAEVVAAIDRMTNEAAQAEKEIEKQQKALQKLAANGKVIAAKSELKKHGLKRTVDALKGEYNTDMSAAELENRMAEIVLRKLDGEDVTADIEALASDVAQNQAGMENEEVTRVLGELRGMTITIGPGQLKELKANDSSLKQIRQRTKGSGIKFVVGTTSTLDTDLDEITKIAPQLAEELQNEKNSLGVFVDYVENLLKNKKMNAYEGEVNEDEVQTFLTASVGIMLNEDIGGISAEQLLANIKKRAGEKGALLDTANEMMASLQGVQEAGKKARAWADVMHGDTAMAIEYFNKMAKLAAERERKRVKEQVIDQLKNDNTRKLIEQQRKYEEQIKNDREKRNLAADNEMLRNQINTVGRRIKNYLTAETDEKNIPEETKPLARLISRMLVDSDKKSEWRRILKATRQQLADFDTRLTKMEADSEPFAAERDLDWLVVKAPNPADNDYSMRDKIIRDIQDIEMGLLEYRNAEGLGKITLQDRKDALKKVQEALSEVYSAIKARGEAFIKGKKVQVEDLAKDMHEDMLNSKFKGERGGTLGKAINKITKSIGYGNLTPEYFIKNLKNRAMTILHGGMQDAEQRSGLEAQKSRERVAQIAEETGYRNWNGQQKMQIQAGGRKIDITLEQLMALYATWQREKNNMRPEDTAHLLKGGFVLAKNEAKGLYSREENKQEPIRITEEELNKLEGYLTPQQKEFVDRIVDYMSNDMAKLGNEASLATYGIKKFTEKYYFPIKAWGGVLNKSSASGVNNLNDNRAMRQGFSKRLTAGARNAILISDFTPTAMKHIAGMINFNTVGPAVENLNKVLNQQLTYGEGENAYKRNMRAAFEQYYGKDAYEYLVQFMEDLNGGVGRRKGESSLRETLLSVFKKNAVAGSLSVAAQQPLSYIRAAMEINPKYLAAAISPNYWKGSYAEMLKYSGIAVIKTMGKFDMNYGQSMIDYITPDGYTSKAKAAASAVTDKLTSLPNKMDAMTWTRMWTACKLEQAAQNPEMDVKSDEFLQKVAERFNEVMRRTQVYDSVMVKSANMRSNSYLKKVTTSFMAEPTLTLNVLADAWKNIGTKGGKKQAVKALVTFLMSAAAQAGAKAFFGTGRTPDKNKNRQENFLNKYAYNLLNEANPLSMIPGYSQLMDVLIDGELKDDAMGMIGKAVDIYDTIFDMAQGEKGKGLYRRLEDTVGQLLQLVTDVPAKNMMRDFRAMVNFFSNGRAQDLTGDSMDQRETSGAVLKYQFIDTLMSQDLIGMVNKRLDEAGYLTTNGAYYDRIYKAMTSGDARTAEEMKEYLQLGKGVSEKTMKSAMSERINKDKSLSGPEIVQQKLNNGTKEKDIKTWITKEYKPWYIAADTDGRRQLMNELTKMYKLIGISGDEAMKIVTKWVEDDKKQKEKEKEGKPSGSGARIASTGGMKFTGSQGMDLLEQNLYANTEGKLYGKGNIDLNARIPVENDDGSISTEISFSFYDEDSGKEVLIPLVVNGEILTEDEAIDHYYETGEYLGKFDTVQEADDYGWMLHNRQDWYYNTYKKNH